MRCLEPFHRRLPEKTAAPFATNRGLTVRVRPSGNVNSMASTRRNPSFAGDPATVIASPAVKFSLVSPPRRSMDGDAVSIIQVSIDPALVWTSRCPCVRVDPLHRLNRAFHRDFPGCIDVRRVMVCGRFCAGASENQQAKQESCREKGAIQAVIIPRRGCRMNPCISACRRLSKTAALKSWRSRHHWGGDVHSSFGIDDSVYAYRSRVEHWVAAQQLPAPQR
jgi:hypothetical protein